MASKFRLNKYENIYDSFKRGFVEKAGITNWNSDSIAKNLVDPFVFELNRINSETGVSLDALQVTKAKGEDLDALGANYGLSRLTATRSFTLEEDFNFYFYTNSSFGSINGGNPITIPIGTRIIKKSSLSGDNVVYVTDKEYILPANEKLYYCSIKCTSLGRSGNVGKTILTKHGFNNYVDSKLNLLKCTNEYPIGNGRNRESDIEFRQRIYLRFAALAENSKDALTMRFLETPGVLQTRLVKNWFGIGTSALFVFGGNKDILRSTISNLQRKIDTNHGFTSRVIVTGGVRVYLDLDLTVWTNNELSASQSQDLKASIGRSISNHFAELQDESVINLSEMVSKITSEVNGISGISNRYSRSKMIDAAYLRKNYATEDNLASERIKLTSMTYSLKENEFFCLGELNLKIEKG